jgi:hypothetical protein
MESRDMKSHHTSQLSHTADAPLDSAFDAALQRHFQDVTEPDDSGFSERVIAALPARRSSGGIRWHEWIVHAQWTAISLAACGVVALTSISDGRASVAHNVAVYALLGLLIFWSIPSRWSRG